MVSIVAPPSEQNEFRIIWDPPEDEADRNAQIWQMGGPEAAPLLAGPGCVQVGVDVECRAVNPVTFDVSTDDLTDNFDFFPGEGFDGELNASLGADRDFFGGVNPLDVSAMRITVRAGEGDDFVEGSDRAFGGPGNDSLAGTGRDDLIDGGEGRDKLFGGAERDTLRGGGDDDVLHGLYGDDLVFGGSGGDRLIGGGGADTLKGGSGEDRIDSAHRDKRLPGGGGLDRAADLVNCGSERDLLTYKKNDRPRNCERLKLL